MFYLLSNKRVSLLVVGTLFFRHSFLVFILSYKFHIYFINTPLILKLPYLVFFTPHLFLNFSALLLEKQAEVRSNFRIIDLRQRKGNEMDIIIYSALMLW